MISVGFSLALLFITIVLRFAFDDESQIVAYAVVYGVILLEFLRRRLLTSLSAFFTLYILMFGIRPLYILFKTDRSVLNDLMGYVDFLPLVSSGMFTGLSAFIAIAIGYALARSKWPPKRNFLPLHPPNSLSYPIPKKSCVLTLLFYQVLGVMLLLAMRGPASGSVYSAAGGAYAYLLPQSLQAAQIYILVLLFCNRARSSFFRYSYYAALVFFALFTFFMKDISIFRGFYVTGAIGMLIALQYARRGRVDYWLLVLPTFFFLPAFQALGSSRSDFAGESFGFAFEAVKSFSPESWWAFFDGRGDMNVFDTFVAASNSTPRFRPFFMAWYYAFLHFIPRGWWPDKPEFGMLVDLSFTQGRPYHPGLVGFYLLDGGLLWMFLSCFLTGFLLYALDSLINRQSPGYFKIALYGVVIINSMYAARGYLHFQIIQYAMMIVPLTIMARLVNRFGIIPVFSQYFGKRAVAAMPK
jgi:hypothetical protein